MLVSDLRARCSARELAEWSVYLSLTAEDFKQQSAEHDLLRIFGNPRDKA